MLNDASIADIKRDLDQAERGYLQPAADTFEARTAKHGFSLPERFTKSLRLEERLIDAFPSERFDKVSTDESLPDENDLLRRRRQRTDEDEYVVLVLKRLGNAFMPDAITIGKNDQLRT